LQRGRYDVVLMDIHMPVMDGIEATRTIRAFSNKTANIPIIAVTADTRPGLGEKYLESGMNGYVIKPFREEAILRTLAQWLQPHRILPNSPGRGLAPAAIPVPGETEPFDDGAESVADEACPILDRAAWAEAQSIYAGNPDGFNRFVGLFQENSRERIATIKAALEGGDLKAIHEAAHSLKSASGFIGATALSTACLQLEDATRNAQGAAEIAELVPRIVQEHRRAAKAIAEALSDLGDTGHADVANAARVK